MNIYKHYGYANDIADFQPPMIHTGCDGAKMEVIQLGKEGKFGQIVLNIHALTSSQKDVVRSAIKQLEHQA